MRPAVPDAILVGAADGVLTSVVAEALEGSGYVVVGARTSLEMLAAARLTRPLVAAIDVRMTGATALARQLAGDAAAGPPLVVHVGPRLVPATVGHAAQRVIHLDATDDGTPQLLQADAELSTRLDRLARQVREGRSASPLTGLPGNAAIRAELERRLRERRPFGLLYADIDSFKPYNDHYGFLRGDHVLRTLGDLLRTIAREHTGAFVGHIGGDDFAVLADDPVLFAEQAVTAFHDVAPRFYDERDARRGWISGKDRRGRRMRWPLLTVSIGIAHSVPEKERDALALVDVATEMKGVAKRSPGSAIAVDRRTPDAGIRPPSRGRRGDRRWSGSRSARARVWRPPRSVAQIARYAAGGVVAALVVVALALGSLVTAASWAQPDDRLWGARLVTEDVRLRLAGDPETRAEVHLSIAADRLAAALVQPGSATELLLDDLDAHVRAARALSDDLPPVAATRLRAALDRQVHLIDAVTGQRVRASDG